MTMTMTGERDDVLIRDEALVTREIGGERIIIQLRRGVADLDSIYTLNDTATWLWDRIDHPVREQELSAALVQEFEVDPTTAAADVARIVAELCAEGLLHRRPAGAPPTSDGLR